MEWYSIRVISGKEKKAEESIRLTAEDNHITEMIDEIFVPTEKSS